MLRSRLRRPVPAIISRYSLAFHGGYLRLSGRIFHRYYSASCWLVTSLYSQYNYSDDINKNIRD